MEFSDRKSYLRGAELKSPSRFYRTIPEMVRKHCLEENRIAHVFIDWKTFEEETLTYKDMYEYGKEFAEGLVELGIKKGDIVAMVAENTPTWVWVMLGVVMCGAIPLNFVFNLKDGSDIESIVKSVGNKCKAIIFPPGHRDTNVRIVEKIFQLGSEKGSVVSAAFPSVNWSILLSAHHESTSHFNIKDILHKRKAGVVLPTLDPDDIMAIFLTSGSTGTPKLVRHSHMAMLVSGHYFAVALGEDNDMYFNDRPFCWSAGFPSWEFFTGHTRVAIRNVSAIPTMSEYYDVLTRIFRKGRVNTALLIPPVLQEIYNMGDNDWSIRSITTSGQAVPATLASLIGRVCDRFSAFYGCAEVGGMSYKEAHTPEEFRDYEVGIPSPGMEIKVVDENGDLMERGIRGEAWIRSVTPFLGYLNNEKKTKEVQTSSGWYKTGDSAMITQDGSLIIDGRLADTQVKIGARFVSVSALESHVRRHPDVRDIVVFSFKDKQNFYCVCCAIIVKDGHQLNKEIMDTFILDGEHRAGVGIFQELELPRSYIFLDTFPRTYNGKIDRKKVSQICKDMLNV